MISLPTPPSFKLQGKRALVTGASSGIGLACATALADAGAFVTLAARGAERLAEVQQAFAAKGWQADIMTLDIADIQAMTDGLKDRDCYDILVNSAGLARHSQALETVEKDYDAVMDINVKGAYFLSQLIAKRLIAENKPGSLIHISSQMAKVGASERAVYCASKHAVEGFIKAMAIEWGPHQIRINGLCPTFIRTPLTEPTFANPEKIAWIKQKIKLGRAGQVEDMMGACLFLASGASSLVTGTSILVDGGWTAE